MMKILSIAAIVFGTAISSIGMAVNSPASDRHVMPERVGEASAVTGAHEYYGAPVIGDPKFWDFHEVPDMGPDASDFESRVRAYYGPSVDAYYGVRNIGDPTFWDFHEVPESATNTG